MKILIIGAGQIGSRHLQGLARLSEKSEIIVVDPSEDSINIARERFFSVEDINSEHDINFFNEIPSIDDINVAIIATSSDIRKNVILDLLKQSSPEHMIIEKIAFKSHDDFKEIISALEKNDIRGWVNCPNRAFESYKSLKRQLVYDGPLFMEVYGGNWGLGSNSIHYLDLFSYLIESSEIEIASSFMDNKIYDSKRNGFIELGGTLIFKSNNDDLLFMRDMKNSTRPVNVVISTQNQHFVVSELLGEVEIMTSEDDWTISKKKFELTNQSSLTTDLVMDIIKRNKTELISLQDSYKLHGLLLDQFLETINIINNEEVRNCPIT